MITGSEQEVDHLKIRSATPDDAGRLLEIYAYYVRNTAITFECEVPAAEEFRRRIENTLNKYPYLVLEENGCVQGYAYAAPLKKRDAYAYSCEESIYLAHDMRKRGYGRKLYTALEEKLKEQGIHNIYACIGSPVGEDEYVTRNSELFHGHMGFEKVGEFHGCGFKFNRWYNIVWMEKRIKHKLTGKEDD